MRPESAANFSSVNVSLKKRDSSGIATYGIDKMLNAII